MPANQRFPALENRKYKMKSMRKIAEETRKEKAERKRSYGTKWRQDTKPPDDAVKEEKGELEMIHRMALRRETAAEMKLKRPQWKTDKENDEAEQEDRSSGRRKGNLDQ